MSVGSRTIPRRLAVACTVGVLALCASLYTTPAQAQTMCEPPCETLISNTEVREGRLSISFSDTTPLAQSFQTGDNPSGYTLHSVVVGFGAFTDSLTTLSAQVRTNTAQNTPSSTVVAEFNEPSPVSDTSADIDIPLEAESGITLDPNTTYHLVLRHTQMGFTPQWRQASRGSMDSGTAMGWRFPQGYQQNPNEGGWRDANSSRDFKMQVRGTAIVPPELDTATISGNTLRLTYGEALDTGSVPAASAFTLGGTSATVDAVAISGMTVILISFDVSVNPTDVVTVTYTVPDMNPVQDLAGNAAAAALDMQSVTNNTPATSNEPPVESLTPLRPGPFTAGMANTFDVSSSQFIDDGDTLTYSLGTVTGPSTDEITVDSTTGVVTIGTSAMAGAYMIQVIATDTASQSATLTYAVTVNPALALPTPDNRVYVVNTAIDPPVTLPAATGGTGDITYTLTGPNGVDLREVPGLMFNATTRVLSGTPNTVDTTTLTYTATDSADNPAMVTQTFTVTVNVPLPTGVMASSNAAGALAVSWTAPDPAPTGGYRVQYRSDGGDWQPADPGQAVAADADPLMHPFTGLAAGMYDARVRSVATTPFADVFSDWVETTGAAVQVQVRTVRIAGDIRVNYNGRVNLGCTNPPTCDSDMFNLEVLFQGVQDSTSGLQFTLTDAPDHGSVGDGDGDLLSVAGTVDWEAAQIGDWEYFHAPSSTPASQNAVTDSFQFDFEGMTYTVMLVINHSPAVMGTPSAGPFTVGGAENTFDVANDFTDRNGDTLTYASGTVMGPVPNSVSINGSVVTIDASATAGEYTIPVTAMEAEEDGGLSATHSYVVTVNNLEISVSAVTASVTEGEDATFTVTASAAPASDLIVNVDVADVGSFIAGPAPTTVTILANMTSATLRVATDDDGADEANGSLTCEVLPGSGYVVAMSPDDSVTVTVNDNDVADTTVPAFVSAAVNGNTLVLMYDEALDESSVPATSAFTLGGTLATVNTVAISGMEVTLTLSAAVSSTDVVTVSYMVPGTNRLRDVAGNDAVALTTPQSVTNSTPPSTPPSPPTGVTTSADAPGELEVSWTAPSPAPAGGYHVQYSSDDGSNWEPDPEQDVVAGTTTHPFTGLAAGMYHARVRSVVGGATSDWVETSSPVQVDVRTIRIDSEIRVNRNDVVDIGCTDFDCTAYNLEVLFRGELEDPTPDLLFELTDAPDHGHLENGFTQPQEVGSTVDWESAHLQLWYYSHHDAAMEAYGSIPSGADVDALTDSFKFSFEGNTYTVNLVINQPPARVAVPSTPGPFTAGTENTFDVAPDVDPDFTDPNGDTLTYALGTLAGPTTTAVTISEDGMVMIDATAMAGTYTIPVVASDSGDYYGDALTVTHTYMVVLEDRTAPVLSTATVNGDMLVLTYSEALDGGSVPATTAFTIGGPAVTVSMVGISGSMVTLTLSSAVTSGDVVTVTYMVPGMNPLRDEAMNNAVALSMQSVTNNTPPSTPPPTPTGLTTSADAPGELEISWTAPDPAPTGGYQVQYSSDDGSNWEPDPEQDVLAGTTTHTFTSLAMGMYHARVRSVVGGVTSGWVETGTAEQVDVRTVRIDSEIRVNRNDGVSLGCTNFGCRRFNLEVLFRGDQDSTPGLQFRLTDVPDHGHVDDAFAQPLEVGSTIDWADAQAGLWYYGHHDEAMRLYDSIPLGADVDALTDPFKFSFEGNTYTVNLVINQPPAVMATPSMPGPFTAGTENTFDVAPDGDPDFTDPNGDTLTYALGTLAGPTTTAVTISEDGMVTIDATAMAGTYTIPVVASDSGDYNGDALTVTHTYMVVLEDRTAPVLSTATVNGDTLVLTYSEALDGGSVPAATAFTIGGPAVTVSMVGISGSMVTLTLSSAVTSTDVVMVTYMLPGTNRLQDVAGNDAVALSMQAVMNNTPLPVPSPTGLTTSAGAAGELEVSWTAPDPAPTGGYHVQYSSDDGSNWLPADPGQVVAAGTITHIFTGLAAGEYDARVRSVVGGVTSAWTETGTAEQVDVRTVRIDSEIRVNRNTFVPLGCIDPTTCNLEVLFRGAQDSTAGLQFRLTDEPDHGRVNDGSGFPLSVGETILWSLVQGGSEGGSWTYNHYSEAQSFLGSTPPGAEEDALADSLEFEFEGTIYRVDITINQPPAVVASPSEPGPFTAGTAATFDVANDFTDPNGDTLTYALGTVMGPTTAAVSISDDGTVTIDATAMAGTYTIPVEASDDGGLSDTHDYVVVVSGSAPMGVTATADAPGRLAVSWTAPDPAPSGGYHVQYSSDGGLTWLPDPEQAVAMDTTTHVFMDLAAGTYSTRVRAVYSSSDTSAWVQGTAVQVDVYELIIKDLEVERGDNVGLGCSLGRIPFGRYTYPNCITPAGATLGIDLEFRGRPVSNTIANSLQSRLIRAPAHGVIIAETDTIGMGEHIIMLSNLRIGDASYQHRHADSPSGADPNVSTDSFDIEIAGVQGTVPVTIFNRAPRIVDTPSQPGPYTAGTEETFDVSGDFTDATRETLTYMSGTVTGPMSGAVMLSGSTVTIGTAATAGTYNIPVTASDGLLDTTYTYTVVVNPEPESNNAPTVVGTPSMPGPYTAGTEAMFGVANDFEDSDTSDTLSYALGTVTGPMLGAVTLMDSTVTVGTGATAGTYSIPVVATDDGTPALSVTHVYQVVVDAANLAPVVVAEPSVPGPFLVGMAGTFDVSGDFRDPDGDPLGDPLTYSLGTVNPASAAVTLAAGTSVVTVGTGATAGVYTVPVTATDGGGAGRHAYLQRGGARYAAGEHPCRDRVGVRGHTGDVPRSLPSHLPAVR